MSKFSKKPLAHMLNTLLRFWWWGGWMLGAVVLVSVLLPNGSSSPRLPVPVKFDDVFIRKIPRIDKDRVHMLIANHGSISIRLESNWQKAIMILCGIVFWAGIMTIIYQIEKIGRSFVLDEPFDKKNLYRIRLIAFILLAYFVAKFIFIMLMKVFLQSMFSLNHIELAYNNDMGFLYVGVVMLILEAVFKRGVILEEEEHLTI